MCTTGSYVVGLGGFLKLWKYRELGRWVDRGGGMVDIVCKKLTWQDHEQDK